MYQSLIEVCANPLNLFFFVVTAICLLAGLASRKHSELLANMAPTIGMLGTFVGIMYALMGFNTTDIFKSIPPLLEGMKTAFATSIAGLLVYVLIKIRWAFVRKQVSNVPAGATTSEQILMELKGIRSALNADQDGSLITQLQKIRTSVIDKGDELSSKFEKFAETMAKNNTDALIAALKDVISDFNTKLTEQFGENFKALNLAVTDLVKWQDQYRANMDELIPEFKKTCGLLGESNQRFQQAMDATATTLANISAIHQCTKLLEATVTGINGERALLEGAIRGFAEAGEKAKDLLPTVNTSLNKMSEELRTNVNTLTVDLRETAKAINSNLDAVSKTVNNTLTRFNADFDNYLKDSSTKVVSRLQEQSKQFDDRFQKQAENLDILLNKELEKSLNSLGSVMANISQKFASDYTPLAEKLRVVMEIIGKQAA